MDKKRKQKNMIIGGLLAIVLVMAVGYAAFATQLNINGTSTISTSWDVEITNIEVLAKSSGASDNAGSPTYDNTKGLTASFNTNLARPGDYATYKIEVTNKGSLNAILSSITGPTSNNNDIEFYLNKNQNNEDITDTDRMIGANDILNATGDSNNLDKGYVYVTVLYRSYEGQTSPTGDNKTATATVTLNFTQSNDGAVVTPTPSTFTGTIYRNNTNVLGNGLAMNGDSTIYYPSDEYSSASDALNDGWFYASESECLADSETNGNCASGTVTLSPGTYYTEDQLSTVNERTTTFGKQYYLKHTVVNDIVQASYVCFVTDSEHCMQGGDASYYTANKTLLQSQESWFNNHSGSCSFGDSDSYCSSSALIAGARSIGYVSASVSKSDGCGVDDGGYSYCIVSGSGGGSDSGEPVGPGIPIDPSIPVSLT